MSRYRLLPTPAQEAVLRDHCGHARYVWNLAVEQHSHWRPGQAGAPGYLEQCRQLTAARPSWRKAGRDEGFRVVALRPGDVRRLSRHVGYVRCLPKGGWVRFRWSRAVPPGAKSYRVNLDRAGRWHVAFAVIPEPIPAPGNGQTVAIACAFACHADVNAAINITAGHAVTARRGDGAARPVNREPQLLLQPA
jgi:putative transposase